MGGKPKKRASSARGGVPSRGWKHWADSEIRYMLQHRADGYLLLAAVLDRSPMAIRRKCARVGVKVGRYPDGGELCPVCGVHRIRDGDAGRAGMCPVCWERRKAEAMEERAAHMREVTRYNAAKKRVRNARAKARREGIDPGELEP